MDKLKPKTPWLNIRSKLYRCSTNDLLNLVAELYSLSSTNKNFLEARFLENTRNLEPYKKIIQRYLAPAEPWKESQRISLKEAKKALSDYKKATSDELGLIELMVYYVECGTEFLCEFGDMYEQYYNSLESVFINAIKLMKNQQDEFNVMPFIKRLKSIVEKARDIGWGYGDAVYDCFTEAYPLER